MKSHLLGVNIGKEIMLIPGGGLFAAVKIEFKQNTNRLAYERSNKMI